MLYGANCRSFSAQELSDLTAADNAILRRLFNLSLPQMEVMKVSHGDLREHIGVAPISAEIGYARLSHGGHLLRRDRDYLPRKAFFGRFIISAADPNTTPDCSPEMFLLPRRPSRLPSVYESFIEACAAARIPVRELAGFAVPETRRDWFLRTRSWYIDATMQHWFFASWRDALSQARVLDAYERLLKKNGISREEFDSAYGDRGRVGSKRAVLKVTPSLAELRAKQTVLKGEISERQTDDLARKSGGIYTGCKDGAGALWCNKCAAALGGSLRALRAHLKLHQEDDFVRIVGERDGSYTPAEEYAYGKSGQCILNKYKPSQRFVLPPQRFLSGGDVSKFSVRQLTCPHCSEHSISWPRDFQKKVGASRRMKTHEKKCVATKKLDLKCDPILEEEEENDFSDVQES
ncbi:unnamed protein product [Amoebophrya sp. A120]|nr:unnamed protein product [Amoebophrya sp. A120]|eukprot:GSA120T00023767001.1